MWPMARLLGVQEWHCALPALCMAPYMVLKAQTCRGRGFYRELSQLIHICQNKLNSVTGDSGYISSMISAPQPAISGTHAHSTSASLSITRRSHNSQPLCLCTSIYSAYNVSLSLLPSKTVKKLEIPVETTSPKEACLL